MFEKKGHICGCGTIEDANEAALKLFEEMIKNDCPVWALQVLTACSLLRNFLVAPMLLTPLGSQANTITQELFEEYMIKGLTPEQQKKLVQVSTGIANKTVAAGHKDQGYTDSIARAFKSGEKAH